MGDARKEERDTLEHTRDWVLGIITRMVQCAEWLPEATLTESRPFRMDCLAASRWALGFAEWYLQPGRLQTLGPEGLMALEAEAWRLLSFVRHLVDQVQRRNHLWQSGHNPDIGSITVH